MSVHVGRRSRATYLFAAALACLGACRAPRPWGAPLTNDAVTTAWRRVPMGLCEDYPEETRSIEGARRDLDVLARAGVRVLRVSIGWDGVEPQDDAFDFGFWDAFVDAASRAGVRLVPYVAYTPSWAATVPDGEHWRRPPRDVGEFREVMATLAARYKSHVTSWELWNEPDNREYWLADARTFVSLLGAGAAGVREGAPSATRVFGGIAGDVRFLATAFALGAGAHVDVVNAHAYFETWNPDPIETLPGYLDAVTEVIAKHGGRQKVWLAEVGYSDHRVGSRVSHFVEARHGFEHTAPFQAVMLVRTLALAFAHPAPQLFAWYELRDLPATDAVIGDANNRHLGVLAPDGRPKPAYAALAFMARVFSGSYRTLVAVSQSSGYARVFSLADGRVVVVAWRTTHGSPLHPGSSPPAEPPVGRVAVVWPRIVPAPIVYDERGQTLGLTAELTAGTRTELPLDPAQVLVAVFSPGSSDVPTVSFR